MENKLSIKQRITLISVLQPISSSAAKRKIINDAIMELSLSTEEIKESKYVENFIGKDLSYVYDSSKDPMKSFNFNEVVLDCLKKAFDNMDQNEQIDGDKLPLFEIFTK